MENYSRNALEKSKQKKENEKKKNPKSEKERKNLTTEPTST